MPSSPGTVSKILWHFPGGPIWDQQKLRQGNKRKPIEAAYDILTKIVSTQTLKTGGYQEIIKLRALAPRYISKSGKPIGSRRHLQILRSAPVCCISDIPVMHLHYHARRYGTIAIGFHRHAVIRHGFSPVFYQLRRSASLQSIVEGLELITFSDAGDAYGAFKDVMGDILEWSYTSGDRRAGKKMYSIETALKKVGLTAQLVSDGVKKCESILAYIKTIETYELVSIYCEREWRSTKAYKFKLDDIAMIVLPKKGSYLKEFLERKEIREIPRSIPIVAREDLIEH